MLQYQSLLKQPEPSRMLLISPFQLESSTLWTLYILDSKTQGVHLGYPLRLFTKDPKWGPSPQLQHRACFLHHVPSGLAQGLLHELSSFNLLEGLLLLTAPCEIVLLPDHLLHNVYSQIAIQNMHSPKIHNI